MADTAYAMLTEAHIRVSTEVLVDKAQQVSKCITDMNNIFGQMESIVNRTNYYWIGEAGDLHRKLYIKQKDTIEEMMRRLREHPRDLQAIAQNYVRAENETEGMANELPGDVIV